jgi:hypothetical protein
MVRAPRGHHVVVHRRHLVIAVVATVLVLLGILLLIGVLRGDDTDLEKRQEDPQTLTVGRP